MSKPAFDWVQGNQSEVRIPINLMDIPDLLQYKAERVSKGDPENQEDEDGARATQRWLDATISGMNSHGMYSLSHNSSNRVTMSGHCVIGGVVSDTSMLLSTTKTHPRNGLYIHRARKIYASRLACEVKERWASHSIQTATIEVHNGSASERASDKIRWDELVRDFGNYAS